MSAIPPKSPLPERNCQAIVIKYFFRTFRNLSDYIPKRLNFTKLFLDPNLEFFHPCFNHSQMSTYLYQKFNFMAISEWVQPIS